MSKKKKSNSPKPAAKPALEIETVTTEEVEEIVEPEVEETPAEPVAEETPAEPDETPENSEIQPETKDAPKEKMVKSSNVFIIGIICAILGAGVTYLAEKKNIDFGERFQTLRDADRFMQKMEVPEPENGFDQEAILDGYLGSYSRFNWYYISGDDSHHTLPSVVNDAPTAAGCGFQIGFNEDGRVCFTEIKSGSLFEELGIKVGDVLFSVDGEEVTKAHPGTAKSILGKEGTDCTIVIDHLGTKREIAFQRKSALSGTDTEVTTRMYGDVAYVRIESIGNTVGQRFWDEMDALTFSSVIIDLRGNGGGVTENAVTIADYFIDDGYATENWYNGESETMLTYDSDTDKHVPIVILTDGETMSAAECVTAMLKKYGDAVTVGLKTYGKGVFQYQQRAGDGFMVYTAGTMTVGDDETWHGKGFEPDYEIPYGDWEIGSEEDLHIQKALELLG